MKPAHSPRMKSADIIVLEDEPEARRVIVDSLEKFTNTMNIRAFECEDKVWRFLDRQNIISKLNQQPAPRLIILDLNIQGIKSFRTLRRLRELKLTRHTPVVVFSDSSDESDIRMSYELGANAFVRKPIRFEAFDEAIESIAHFWLDINQI